MPDLVPHILDTENDPRILRDLAKMLLTVNQRQSEIIAEIQAEQAKEAQLKFKIEVSLNILRKKYFGRSSEKPISKRDRNRLNDSSELTLHSQNLLPPLEESSVRKLNVVEIVHELDPEELRMMSESLGLLNPSASQWEEVVGLFDKSSEITITERTYQSVLHKRKKARLKKEFQPKEKHVMVTAPGPTKLVPGGSYSIEFTTSVIVDKFLNHMPLDRQARSMESLGLPNMSTQVLYNLTRLASEHLKGIAERVRKEILLGKVVHCDETRWPINNKKDSNGHFWIIANNRGSHYQFEPSRSGKIIKEILKGFSGIIVSDAYSGYYQFKKKKKIDDPNLALCHSHARRYFWDIKEDYEMVNEVLLLYENLFKLEYLARNFDELKEIRNTRSRPIIEAIYKWIDDNMDYARGESHLLAAVKYLLNHKTELTKFLDIPEIPLTNNEAERTIRQSVLGRKNFYGSRSIDGADVAAIMYTLIESCKKVELDPREYLLATLHAACAGDPTETPFEMAKRQRQ